MVGQQLDLYPGLKNTLYFTESGAVLNADITFKHVWRDPIAVLIKKYVQEGKSNDQVSKMFTNKNVLVKYSAQNQKCVRIHGVRFDLHPTSTFAGRSGTISYAFFQ